MEVRRQKPLRGRELAGIYLRKMNYLKFRADRLREALDPARPGLRSRRDRAAPEGGAGGQEPDHPRQPAAGRLDRQEASGASNTFFELVSDGNMSLFRAVDKFDFASGFKFSRAARGPAHVIVGSRSSALDRLGSGRG
jgi:RNA polymerase primary sigma factor